MPPRPSLESRFRDNLRALGVEDDARVVVALSGGADSVALLHLVRFAAAGLRLTVAAAHLDHAMRPESAADARWLAGLCAAWGVPLVSWRAGRAPRTEAEARRARYAFLAEARGELRAGWVATAHHADDQAETVLFRVLRGTGVAGVAGIAPVDARRGLVRPLLPFTRAELRRYARAHRLRWREDPTNALLHPARNRIRHQLLPLAERTVAPGARAALARLAALARESEAAWEALLAREIGAVATERDGAVVLVRERLSGYDSAVGARILRSLLRRFGVVPDRDGTRSALRFIGTAPSGRVLELPGGVTIRTEFGSARIERASAPPPPDAPLVITGERGRGTCRIGGVERTVSWRPAGEAPGGGDGAGDAVTVAIDGEAALPFLLRGRLPGDRVRTPAGSRTLKRLFNDRRVPRGARPRVPVLADAAGRVLWVAGITRGAPAPARGERGMTVELDEMPDSELTLARTGGRELSRIVYTEEQIARRVAEMGHEIAGAYDHAEPLLVLGLLKGSFIFLSDLVRQIARPLHVDFIVASSYGSGTTTSGTVNLLYDPSISLEGKRIILVEDIVDSGTTVSRLIPMLEERGPKSLEICTLLHKHIAANLVREPRWVGFDAPHEFLIGYGLDHSEDFRNLPFIGSL